MVIGTLILSSASFFTDCACIGRIASTGAWITYFQTANPPTATRMASTPKETGTAKDVFRRLRRAREVAEGIRTVVMIGVARTGMFFSSDSLGAAAALFGETAPARGGTAAGLARGIGRCGRLRQDFAGRQEPVLC